MRALSIALFIAIGTFSFATIANAASLPQTVNVIPTPRPESKAEQIRRAFESFPSSALKEYDMEWTAEFIYGTKFIHLLRSVGEGSETVELKVEVDGYQYTVDDEGTFANCTSAHGEDVPCGDQIDGVADEFHIADFVVANPKLKKRLANEYDVAIHALLDYTQTASN